jgi:multidrug resistance efflux pump
VESEQAQLGLAEAQRDLAQTRLEAANLKVEIERAQLALEKARAESNQTRAELDSTSRRADQLELALAAARTELADDDEDGVWNDVDRCSDTRKGQAVDASGCSVAQFCMRYDVRNDEGRAGCWNADFGNDEPLGNPADCKANSRSCVPR